MYETAIEDIVKEIWKDETLRGMLKEIVKAVLEVVT